MSLLFHPKTLELLANFKTTGRMELLDKVLPLVIDNAHHIDISLLSSIVRSYSSFQESLEAVVQRLFVKITLENRFVCVCRELQGCEHLDLILENRKNACHSLGNTSSPNFIASLETAACMQDVLSGCTGHQLSGECFETCLRDVDSRVQDTANHGSSADASVDCETLPLDCTYTCSSHDSMCANKTEAGAVGTGGHAADSSRKKVRKAPIQSNTLNFAKTSAQKSDATERFTPLELKNASFVYDRSNVVLDTQRKRDDLVNPVQLQFIKHFDQTRPPIYQKRGEVVKAIVSCVRLPQVLSYDENSSDEWEEVEESGSDALTEESTEEVLGDEDWVERDSEDDEVTRFNKKPTFIFQPIAIETYFNSSEYLNAPLFESSIFPSNLLQTLVEFKETFQYACEGQLAAMFSSLYLVSLGAVLEQLSHLS